jgi:DNA-binding MarR family transcriptional regulator
MNLDTFLPYRLALLAETVSQALAIVYRDRFDLSRDEWRILAALSEADEAKTSWVIARTTLDKMRVSRAVARMVEGGLLEKSPDPEDRRNFVLRLLPAGRALYARIVPMALSREEFLLEALDPAERAAFLQTLTRIHERAEQLVRQG